MKKKILLAALCLIMNTVAVPRALTVGEEISAECGVLYEPGGEVLWERRADSPHLIASTTKLMTALVVLEQRPLTDVVDIRPEYCGLEGSSMYLMAGQHLTVEELLTGLLLASGNDAAYALAVDTSGSAGAFADEMNRRARELGMSNSHFENPHGLDGREQYSTALDLAKLMAACCENEDFVRIASQKSGTAGAIRYENHNKLLSRLPGCIAGKTGYTMAAGRCLVSCCEREGLRLICVTLNAPDDWNDHTALYEAAYKTYRMATAAKEGERFAIPVANMDGEYAFASPQRTLRLLLTAEDELRIVREMPRFTYAPVSQGEYAGRIIALVNGEKREEIPLFFAESVTVRPRQRAKTQDFSE